MVYEKFKKAVEIGVLTGALTSVVTEGVLSLGQQSSSLNMVKIGILAGIGFAVGSTMARRNILSAEYLPIYMGSLLPAYWLTQAAILTLTYSR